VGKHNPVNFNGLIVSHTSCGTAGGKKQTVPAAGIAKKHGEVFIDYVGAAAG